MLAALTAALLAATAPGDWPSFRGAGALGIGSGHATPTSWDVESGRNVAWATPIPGLAHSSPIVYDNSVYVTTAVRRQSENAELRVGLYGDIGSVEDEGPHEFKIYCLSRGDGSIKWETTATTAVPKIKRHPKGSHAASTPATDGRVIVSLFASEGLFCHTVDGDLKWSKDLGVLDSGFFRVESAQWGFASSPIIYGDLVIVQCDIQKGSFLAAFDVESGDEVWRTSREEVPTWSTPTVHVGDDRSQIICNGWKHIGGYDLETGKELWTMVGGGDIPVPTPIVIDDLIYITNAHGRQAPIVAIRTDAHGELQLNEADEHVAWHRKRRGNYMQTPIVYNDLAFFCNDAGVVACYDPETGEEHFRARLGSGGSGYTASPVAADGKIYYTSEQGDVQIIRAASTFQLTGANSMGELCMATPAISGPMMIWRTRDRVIAVQQED